MASSISFDILEASCWRAMRSCFSCGDSDEGGLNEADQESSSITASVRRGREEAIKENPIA